MLKRPFDHLDKLGIFNRLTVLSKVEGLTALSGIEGLKRIGNSHSEFDIGFMKTNEIKLRSGATTPRRGWTFIFKTNPVWHKCNV